MAFLKHVQRSINIFRLSRNYSTKQRNEYDVIVVGGGIVGVATAREVALRFPKLQIAIVEKENKLAAHQSSHNSGVLHAGIYYKPDSLKAKLCTEGMRLAYAYYDKKKIPYKKCGKLIVATNKEEVERLLVLYDNSLKNKVPDVKLVDSKEISEIEPHCRGVKAIWSPHTGIVDYRVVTESYCDDFKQAGGQLYLNFEVTKFHAAEGSDYPVAVTARNGQTLKAKNVFTCGGLYSDKLAVMSACSKVPQIIPFRGEYLMLNPSKRHLVKGNIYPVPDPRFPFLGVHFTPRMDGSVILGPNAVLALRREGYKWSDINIPELFETVTYPGFMRMALKYMVPGTQEALKSLVTSFQVKHLQKYIPEVTPADVSPGPAGVRAQAMDRSGALVDDFVFDSGSGPFGKRILHCRNAPSPAATSSLAIAAMLTDKLQQEFGLSC